MMIILRDIPTEIGKRRQFLQVAKTIVLDCKPPHAHSPDVTSGTVCLRIDVHDIDNDNA